MALLTNLPARRPFIWATQEPYRQGYLEPNRSGPSVRLKSLRRKRVRYSTQFVETVTKAKDITEQKGVEWTSELEVEETETARKYRRKRVWNGTFKKVGLPLSKAKREPRGQQVAYHYLDPEDPDITLFLEVIGKERTARLGAAKSLCKHQGPIGHSSMTLTSIRRKGWT